MTHLGSDDRSRSTAARSALPPDVDQAISAFFAAYFEAFNSRDMDHLMDCWTPDCEFRTRPGFADLKGREAIRRVYEQLWSAANERVELFRLAEESDVVLAEIGTEITARVDMADFGEAGLAAGERLTLRSVVAYRLRDGAIAHIEGRAVISRAIEKSPSANPTTPAEYCGA